MTGGILCWHQLRLQAFGHQLQAEGLRPWWLPPVQARGGVLQCGGSVCPRLPLSLAGRMDHDGG
jgi:hypothetical protein